jgi:hypothetical protein
VELDRASVKARRLLVHRAVRGVEDLTREAPGALEEEVKRLPAMVGERRESREARSVEELIKKEVDVPITDQGILKSARACPGLCHNEPTSP